MTGPAVDGSCIVDEIGPRRPSRGDDGCERGVTGGGLHADDLTGEKARQDLSWERF